MPRKREANFGCGHPRVEENTIHTTHNKDICRTCNNANNRRNRLLLKQVKSFRLPPAEPRPLGYDPNFGRSYNSFPKKERFA